MNIKDQIRAEIERKLKIAEFQAQKTAEENNYEAHLQWNQQVAVYNELLRFIDSLQDEPQLSGLEMEINRKSKEAVIAEYGQEFEDEIERYHQGYWPDSELGNESLTYSKNGARNLARHFYELGCRRTAEMYDDIEYNRQMAEENQPVEGLEEEIERFYRTDEYRIADTLGRGFETLARHFAEWGRKQALQEIYDGKVKPVDKITAAWLDVESKDKEDK